MGCGAFANRGGIGPWETFTYIELGNNKVALLSKNNNKYVCAESEGWSPLIANRDGIGPWETFTVLPGHGGEGVGFRAEANGKIVCSECNGDSFLIANRDGVGPW